jgi:leucyl-tRNA synthetase
VPGCAAAELERRWQERWEEEGTNAFTDAELRALGEDGRPFYNLMMFPYPSAEGLHVGNIYAFTGADIYGRFQRLRGHDVFEPIGFDAFGIHSENFALKIGTHPMELIPRNVERFTTQLRRVGLMYDWNHTVDTTAPEYYRWTQWIFLQLYKAGLAVKKEAPVNWCPSCNTVLANEQVVGGECERCGTPVEMRNLSQWFFRITDYAGRLLDNLSWIDWSESTKKAQENWIGPQRGGAGQVSQDSASWGQDRTETADLLNPESQIRSATIQVFTTRPDTSVRGHLHGAGSGAPAGGAGHHAGASRGVEAYRQQVAQTDLVSRKKTDKEKTGVDTGGTRPQPGHRRGDARLDRRLRADGVRNRRDHGRPRPRPARLRVRHEVRVSRSPRRRGGGEDAARLSRRLTWARAGW